MNYNCIICYSLAIWYVLKVMLKLLCKHRIYFSKSIGCTNVRLYSLCGFFIVFDIEITVASWFMFVLKSLKCFQSIYRKSFHAHIFWLNFNFWLSWHSQGLQPELPQFGTVSCVMNELTLLGNILQVIYCRLSAAKTAAALCSIFDSKGMHLDSITQFTARNASYDFKLRRAICE